MALWPSRRIVSTMPSAVSGLTKEDAPAVAGVPSGSSRHWEASMHRYCAYMAPPATATVLPASAWAPAEDPALTTVPAPSFPTGIDLPTRLARALIAAAGMLAVTTGLSMGPETFAVPISAPANRSPRSEGLMGDASIRISTSLGWGSEM